MESEPRFDRLDYWTRREAEAQVALERAQHEIARILEDHRMAYQGQQLDEARRLVDENALTQAEINERFRTSDH